MLPEIERLVEVDVDGDGHRRVRRVLRVVDALREVGRVDPEHDREPRHQHRADRGRELLTVDRHGVDDEVLGEDVALVVEDPPAHRRHRHDAVAVALGGDRELLAAGDLQEPEAHQEAAEEHQHDGADHREP